MNTNMIISILLAVLIIVIIVQFYFIEHYTITDNFDSVNSEHYMETSNNTVNDQVIVVVFLSTTCPHCVHYDEEVHETLSEQLKKNNINLGKIYSNNDPDNLFDKFNVEYVPAAFVFKGIQHKKLPGPITYEGIMNIVNSM